MREQDNSASLQLANGPKLGPFAAGSVLYSLPHLCRLSSNFCRIGGSGKSKSDLNRSRDGRAEGVSREAENPSFCSFHHFHPRATGKREGLIRQTRSQMREGGKEAHKMWADGKKATMSNRILIFFFETY